MPVNYVAVLFRYLWLLMLSGALGGGLAYYYGEQQPLVYEATAMVLYEDQRPQILNDVAPVVEATPGNNYWAKREFIETQLRLLGSTELAELVVERWASTPTCASSAEHRRSGRARSALATSSHRLSFERHRIEPVEESTSSESCASITQTLLQTSRPLQRSTRSKTSSVSWCRATRRWNGSTRSTRRSARSLRRPRTLCALLGRERPIAVTLEEHVSLSQLMLVTSDQLVLAQRAGPNHSVPSRATQIMETGDWQAADVPAIQNALIQQVKSEPLGGGAGGPAGARIP